MHPPWPGKRPQTTRRGDYDKSCLRASLQTLGIPEDRGSASQTDPERQLHQSPEPAAESPESCHNSESASPSGWLQSALLCHKGRVFQSFFLFLFFFFFFFFKTLMFQGALGPGDIGLRTPRLRAKPSSSIRSLSPEVSCLQGGRRAPVWLAVQAEGRGKTGRGARQEGQNVSGEEATCQCRKRVVRIWSLGQEDS